MKNLKIVNLFGIVLGITLLFSQSSFYGEDAENKDSQANTSAEQKPASVVLQSKINPTVADVRPAALQEQAQKEDSQKITKEKTVPLGILTIPDFKEDPEGRIEAMLVRSHGAALIALDENFTEKQNYCIPLKSPEELALATKQFAEIVLSSSPSLGNFDATNFLNGKTINEIIKSAKDYSSFEENILKAVKVFLKKEGFNFKDGGVSVAIGTDSQCTNRRFFVLPPHYSPTTAEANFSNKMAKVISTYLIKKTMSKLNPSSFNKFCFSKKLLLPEEGRKPEKELLKNMADTAVENLLKAPDTSLTNKLMETYMLQLKAASCFFKPKEAKETKKK